MSEKKLSGIEKAAILLKTLQPEVVEKVLRHMDARQGERLRADLVKISERADFKEVMGAVLDEAAKIMKIAPDKPDGFSNPSVHGATSPAIQASAAPTSGRTKDTTISVSELS